MVDTSESYMIYGIEVCFCVLSIMGSLFNIFGYIYFKSIRCFALETVFYLSISCLLTNISYMSNNHFNMNHDKPSSLCTIQGFMILWFETSQSIWATLISYSIYTNVLNFDKKVVKTSLKTRLSFLFIGYVIPLCFSTFLLIDKKIGPSGNWCYILIKDDGPKTTHLYIIIYSIIWILFIISVIMIVRVVLYLKKLLISEEEKESIYKYIERLRLFPLIQLLILIPCTISRTGEHFDWWQYNNNWLNYFVVLITYSQGFLYAIVYGLNPVIRNSMNSLFRNLFGCKKKEYVTISTKKESDFSYQNLLSDQSLASVKKDESFQ